MKKIILLMAVALFVVTSCSGQNKKGEKASANTVHLTKADFIKNVADIDNSTASWKYLGDKPAIIDFYADWCGPCKTIAPILEELAAEYKDKIYIYKVNVDKEPELAAAFGIQSIPALLFAPLKGDPQMALGAMPKADLKKAIDDVLLDKPENGKE